MLWIDKSSTPSLALCGTVAIFLLFIAADKEMDWQTGRPATVLL
jgi:hypothetical protein